MSAPVIDDAFGPGPESPGNERQDLGTLLAEMQPERSLETYVFAVVRPDQAPEGIEPFATVLEAEGLTLILDREQADRAGLSYEYVFARISLGVYSQLTAVGLTAAVSGRLADAGISCNVIAGFSHDHLFVPADRADQAIGLLLAMPAELYR